KRPTKVAETLEAHLADERVHGTAHEAPRVRFERDEKHALQALPSNVLPAHSRLLRRRVATYCLVDVDTVRYSVRTGSCASTSRCSSVSTTCASSTTATRWRAIGARPSRTPSCASRRTTS